MTDIRDEVLQITPSDPPTMAWVAKYAVTFYHGCDNHPGDWLTCDLGPCPLFRAALPTVVRTGVTTGLTQRELLDLFDRCEPYPGIRQAIRAVLQPEGQ